VDANGGRYLRLRTIGAEDRQQAGQVNQTMLFDENAVRQLLEIITQQFPPAAESPEPPKRSLESGPEQGR
jgi:hypothetical protein